MQNASLFVGLPADLAPPEKSADALAALSTAAERLAFVERIPAGGWRSMIVDLAQHALAQQIVETRGVDARRSMLAEVPEGWRPLVEGLVASFWATRHLRAPEKAAA